MSNHDPLRDALRSRAEELGDPNPLTLDDVKGRARGIRRRRAAVSGLAAAAVLAVAVPMGIAVTDRVGTSPQDPPVAGPSVPPTDDGSASPDGSPAPKGPQRVPLTVEVDGTSYAPEIPYLYDGTLVRPDGTEVAVDGDYRGFAPVGDGWVATRTDDEGNAFVDLLDPEGRVTGSEPSTGALAGSSDGTVAAFATPDGQLMTVTPGAAPTSLVEPEALPDGFLTPVAVLGSDSCDEDAAGGGCAVFFDSADAEDQAAWSATAKGIVSPFPGLLGLGGISPDGSTTGTTSVSMDGSCSALVGPDRGEIAWKTCDYTLGRFSPDGRYVIGHPAYQSGFGDASVAILDARTGNLLAEFQSSAEPQAAVYDVVWDTDSTLVATVFEEGTWSLMRMAADASLTTVLADLGGDMDTAPLVLPTRP